MKAPRKTIPVGSSGALLPAVLLTVFGCGWFDGPFIWPGLEPLEEENLAPLPGSEEEPHPEILGVAKGQAEDYEWAHARGWVHAPVADVWRALQDPDVLVERRRVDEWSTEYGVDPDVPVSFTTHQVVRDVLTMRFAISWRQAHVMGIEEEPLSVWIRGDLVPPGTFVAQFMREVRTGLILEAESDDITEIRMVRHIDAFATGADEAARYLEDLYESVLAVVRGEPLPKRDIERM